MVGFYRQEAGGLFRFLKKKYAKVTWMIINTSIGKWHEIDDRLRFYA